MKKAIALIALLAILIFAALVLINQFYPNPYTSGIYTFIIVTVPAYLRDKLEWVFGAIGVVMATIGAASKKIGKVRDEANAQVETAQSEKNRAQEIATDQIGTVQNLQNENTRLKDELNGVKTTRTEAEQLLSQSNEEVKSLRRQNQELMDKLANTPVKTVEVVK